MDRPGLRISQRLLIRGVGHETAAAMEAHSRAWLVACPNCGLEQSVWDLGGVRYGAVGALRLRRRCPRCGEVGWHKLHKAANFPAGEVPSWPIVRLVLSVLLVLLLVGAVGAVLVLELAGVI